MGTQKEQFDVIIIGGGPAGLSAAMWCEELGLKTVVLESTLETGGQLLHVYNPIENYPGMRTENGAEMAESFTHHSEQKGVVVRRDAGVIGIDPKQLEVALPGGEHIAARAIIIATGVRRRRLNIPGENEFEGRGILSSGVRDAALLEGKNVLIVGGGDAALENALILSEKAEKVYLCHRRDEFAGREAFIGKVRNTENVEILRSHQLVEIAGSQSVEWVRLRHADSGEHKVLKVDGVLIRAGVEPNTGFLDGIVEMDERGYIKANRESETSAQGIYAIGDVANPVSPTVATAVGTGATAAKAVYAFLNPSR